MAKYNTFVVQSTKGKTLMVTSSARKALSMLQTGIRIDVWNENAKVNTVYSHTKSKMDKYTDAERQHIKDKQIAAEYRNLRKRYRV